MWMQSTGSYASSMGVCTTPIPPRSAVKRRRTGLAGKSTQCNPCTTNALHKHNTTYVQLSAKVMKLEKSNKKLKYTNKA
jgi:hypothetical protein